MTAQDFTGLRLQYGAAQKPGELPTVIEHDFADGRMVDHYYVTPSPAFWADEGVKALGEVSGLLFLQQPSGAPWQILVHEKAMLREVVFDFPQEEFDQMLAASGVILPGAPGFTPPPPAEAVEATETAEAAEA